MLKPVEVETLEKIVGCIKIIDVALEFLALQNRTAHPEGTWGTHKRFYLANKCACCDGRTPSRAWPNSEMLHGRTLIHVATAAGIEDNIIYVTRYIRLFEKFPSLKKSGAIGVEMLLKLHHELVEQWNIKLTSMKAKEAVKTKKSKKPQGTVKKPRVKLQHSEVAVDDVSPVYLSSTETTLASVPKGEFALNV